MKALSISAAAAEAGHTPGLWVGGRSYCFDELAARSAALPWPSRRSHLAQSDLDTVLLLYKSLEEGRPLCLLSPQIGEQERAECEARLPSEGSALVLFTSGSVGRRKGVRLSPETLLASARASEKHLGWFGADHWLCALPLHHIGGLSVLLRCLVARVGTHLCEGFDTNEIALAFRKRHITHISLVPTMLWRLLEAGVEAPPHLRITLIGGAALDPALADRARAAGYQLYPSYGMTETAAQILCEGRPLPTVELRVREGCLEVRGPMLMDGYLLPDRPSQIAKGAWFRTSDRAHIDDEGRVTIVGRQDEIIISGGENIDPRRVENLLVQDTGIQASYALGVPDAEWGQQLVALVVLGPEAKAPLAPGVRGHQRPKRFVPVPALPLLDNGKVDRQAALALAQSVEPIEQ